MGMAPMKAMKGKKGAAMTKSALLNTIADECELKRQAVTSVLTSLASIASAEVKNTGIFVNGGCCAIKCALLEALHRVVLRMDRPRGHANRINVAVGILVNSNA